MARAAALEAKLGLPPKTISAIEGIEAVGADRGQGEGHPPGLVYVTTGRSCAFQSQFGELAVATYTIVAAAVEFAVGQTPRRWGRQGRPGVRAVAAIGGLGRLTALPDEAELLERARLLAALSVGAEIIELRQMAPSLGAAAELDAAFEAIAPGNGAIAIAQLRQLDRRLASSPETLAALRGRGRMLVVCEALAEQISHFDTGALA